MDPGVRSPLIDLFRRGEAPREVKLLAARGVVAPRAHEQLALLAILVGDADEEIAAAASRTLDDLPRDALAAFIARADVPGELREFFRSRGIEPAVPMTGEIDAPLVEHAEPVAAPATAEGVSPEGQEAPTRVVLSSLPVIDRIKIAMQGTREQRSQLIRDPNRLVAAAVLSSPKLSDSEIEAFARMANVSEEVLRVIGTSRAWLKNYGVVLALTRNPKTPPAISMQLATRLNARDVKALSIDRNVPEGLRLTARKLVASAESRKQ